MSAPNDKPDVSIGVKCAHFRGCTAAGGARTVPLPPTKADNKSKRCTYVCVYFGRVGMSHFIVGSGDTCV